ncbi:Uncharacterised protein [BD1-7 clade bacterium]|uniref:DUF1330 domain-containing protein n=1 Tax=BD1-7 clade bacterium TaxID=2029982 RepID=A0A5S9NKY0_9GAMM|nr:Uncharacterised protein [BD1-7 clade bacterium]CAA0093429.1 Uncharacterised protein [BD1-7 clade bacterium]
MYEMLVGLEVQDNDVYRAYRAAMMPILETYGGSFGYDFEVSNVLKSETPENINRVFTIQFPSEEIMSGFFINSEYLLVKDKYFESSVHSTTIIASYEKHT